MKNWSVWSTDNFVDWVKEGNLEPKDTYLAKDLAAGKKIGGCWATCCVSRNGKYYWYYCSSDNIGVSVSDSPRGPWRDPLGKPLIAKSDTLNYEFPTGARDPDILLDDDGKAYLVFGVYNYYIARLNDDMISLAEQPRPVPIINKRGPTGEGTTDDKPALHKRNGKYYLSWCSFYAMSDNIYGPYLCKGSVIDRGSISEEFQFDRSPERSSGSELDDYLKEDRHGDFFEFNNQWYYESNDLSKRDGGRHIVMAYAHYRDNGEIAPVRIDRTGVGQYDAFNRRTQAEDYFKSVSAEVREGVSGGFVVQQITTATQLYYPRVMNLCKNASMTFYAASSSGCEIEIHEGNPSGKLLGVCKVDPTEGLDSYKTFTCRLANQEGTGNLCLTFKGGSGELLRLDFFSFPDSLKCKLPRGTWSASASSESVAYGAQYAIDGSERSFWGPDSSAALPQSLTVDMKSSHQVKGVQILQRSNNTVRNYNYPVNYITRYAVYVSKDGKTYQKATEGNWKNDFTLKQVKFPPQEARFVRLEILETSSSDAQPGRKGSATIAEIYVITTKR